MVDLCKMTVEQVQELAREAIEARAVAAAVAALDRRDDE